MRKTTSALLALASLPLALVACLPQNEQLTRLPSFYVGPEPVSATPGDFNGDGKQDLVVTRAWGGGELSILLGVGDGTFTPAGSIAASGHPGKPAVVDIDGDGKMDLVVLDLVHGGFVSVLLGRGDGTFQEPVHHLVGIAATRLKVQDINGDGKADLVAINVRPDTTSTTQVIASKLTTLIGHGDGTFEAAHAIDLYNAPQSLWLADADGDGKIDALLADSYRHQLLFMKGNGDGTFGAERAIHVGLDPYDVTTADINKDGRPDLVVGVAGGFTVLLGTGKGEFMRFADYYTEPSRSHWIVDLDKDGNLDVVSARRVLRGDGTGHFTATELPHAVNDDSWVTTADFNGDGWPDIVSADLYHNQINVYLNRGGKLSMSASR